jgi:hypothetical protein
MEHLQQDAIGAIIRGTIIEDDVAVDVAAVTTKQLVLRKPNGSVLTKTATFTTDGTDGKIQYATIAGDLDVSGVWESQARVIFSGGFNGRSEIQKFFVDANL